MNGVNHMEQKLNMNSDLLNSKSLLLILLNITKLMDKHQLWVSTISLTGLMMKERDLMDTGLKIDNKLRNHFILITRPLMKSIGPQKVLLLQLRIKDNVDHAGLSPPQVLLKELISLQTENLISYLSNNS